MEIESDGTRRIVPAETPRGFCPDCETLIGVRLAELPEAYERLQGEVYEPHSRRSKDIRSPLGPTVPLRTDIDALMRLMAVVLGGWEARVRVAASLSRADVGPAWGTPEQIQRAVDIIGARLSVLLALQADWTIRSIPLPMGKSATDGLPDDIAEAWGSFEIRARGVGDLRLWARLDGTAAGLEIFDLAYRCRSVLGETRAPRETLDGVPCRSCESMSLERAEPPSDPSKPAPYSACAACQATMSEDDYRGWSKWYSGWASGVERTCIRCAQNRCDECEWDACACEAEAHQMLAAA